jgi:hypothetical protein
MLGHVSYLSKPWWTPEFITQKLHNLLHTVFTLQKNNKYINIYEGELSF